MKAKLYEGNAVHLIDKPPSDNDKLLNIKVFIPDNSASNITKMLTDINFNTLKYSFLDDSHDTLINVKAKIVSIAQKSTPKSVTIKK